MRWKFQRMRRTSHSKRSGFTLVEVAISTMIVAASAGVFFALMPMSFKTGKMVGSYQQASSLLQHKVDQMRGVGYGRLTYSELKDAGIIDSSPSTQPYSFKTVDGLTSLYSVPTATVEITDFSATVKQVKVRLQWTGSSMQQGRGDMTVTGLIAKG
jgi:type II secretory pathway pseudopilin PulG